jgi:hypothetical protein
VGVLVGMRSGDGVSELEDGLWLVWLH